jgi:hypothetical protein
MPVGQPTKYKEEYNDQVFKLCLLGATDVEIADFFGVVEKTINNWKKYEPSFLQSLKKGKIEADMEVASSLYNLAKGYTQKEDQVTARGDVVEINKYHPANERSNARWLHNRRASWRENSINDDQVLKIEFTNPKKKK